MNNTKAIAQQRLQAMARFSFLENNLLIQILLIFQIIIKVPPLRVAAERYRQFLNP